MATVRAFVGVKVPCGAELRRVLAEAGKMGRAVRPVAAENLHVTVKFLGDVSMESTASVGEAFSRAAASIPAFEIRLRGLGAFPHPGRPAVIWVGMDDGEAMTRLAEALEAALEPLGFSREHREFHPHVTIARIKSRPPDELRRLLDEHSETDFGGAPVNCAQLFQSERGPQGVRHTVLSEAALGGGGS